MSTTQQTTQQLVTEKEAAHYIGMSPMFLRVSRLKTENARGDAPPYIKIGRAVRYQVSDLNAFVQARRVELR